MQLVYDTTSNLIYLFGGWNSETWQYEFNEFIDVFVLDYSKI